MIRLPFYLVEKHAQTKLLNLISWMQGLEEKKKNQFIIRGKCVAPAVITANVKYEWTQNYKAVCLFETREKHSFFFIYKQSLYYVTIIMNSEWIIDELGPAFHFLMS